MNLSSPWKISELEFKECAGGKELHITIGHEKRAKFVHEKEECSVYDHQFRTWRHLDFFEHVCYLRAKVPRVKTGDGSVRLVQVPWAERGSSFTLLFEGKVRELVRLGMSATGAGASLRISGKQVFGVIRRSVSHALATQPLEDVGEASLDEVSSRKGHRYLTVLTDRKRKKVVGIGEGRDAAAVGEALMDMEVRGAYREKVKSLTMDMSKAYISAAGLYFALAAIIFDRFHIAKKMNGAVDQIRREEQARFKELKNSRYLWLKDSGRLGKRDREKIGRLSETYPNIGEAYRLKEMLKSVLDQAYRDHRLKWLNAWVREAWASGLEPVRQFVNMLHRHWYGVKTFFKYLATNAYAERVNLKIQEIKRIAKGYRNINNFKLMIYFHLGGLDLDKPTK